MFVVGPFARPFCIHRSVNVTICAGVVRCACVVGLRRPSGKVVLSFSGFLFATLKQKPCFFGRGTIIQARSSIPNPLTSVKRHNAVRRGFTINPQPILTRNLFNHNFKKALEILSRGAPSRTGECLLFVRGCAITNLTGMGRKQMLIKEIFTPHLSLGKTWAESELKRKAF